MFAGFPDNAEAIPGSTTAADGRSAGVASPTARLGVFHHVVPKRQTPGMTTDEDLFHAAVAAVERRIAPLLFGVAPSRHSIVAEAAVRAAAPFLDGTERARVEATGSGGTVQM